jgi:pimeloyl-ACP methyl ester carboxylesterase
MRNNTYVPEHHAVSTADGLTLRLTRWPGGTKGPVLLVHGAGVWSGMFALPTIKTNFLQALIANGYDVWLFDWRGSTCLPLTQFTFDQAAELDFPAAVQVVLEKTGAESLQAVVHCAGSTAFFMSLALGLMSKVRCVVASQVALHPVAPFSTKLKSFAHLPELLDALGREYMTPDEDPSSPLFQSLFGRYVDSVHHECTSTVCHRITFMYGHLYSHASLNQETHERLSEQFGKCNVTTFRHLAQLVRAGVSRKFDYGASENLARYGQAEPPDYLRPEPMRIPITFVSGAENRTFLPASTEQTFEWLKRENGEQLYRRHVVPDYGHIDKFMGANASRDVYPLFLEQLESCPQ